jgi:hypothetical protein
MGRTAHYPRNSLVIVEDTVTATVGPCCLAVLENLAVPIEWESSCSLITVFYEQAEFLNVDIRVLFFIDVCKHIYKDRFLNGSAKSISF